ncbi:MAG: glycosyl hydrolase family 8 [Paracoccus sp. (in: a-proteobacteria)]|uniref:glycosyl hydrolase family 8 n=1 Tax=Paracoccus sp. TaxID=267 RepID=UPI0039E497C6
MRRRTLLSGFAAAAMLARGRPARAQEHPLAASWQAWKALCLSEDGRVVDGFQKAASHSEGQGYGLALAAIFDDRAAFDAILDWTQRNLAIRDDTLLAWRWQPDARPQVPDHNNAADGDLFHAWALVLAAARQSRPDLAERAEAVTRDLLRLCTAPHPAGDGSLLFLPGAAGFRSAEQVVVNPSYYMPRAMRELAEATGQPQLRQLAEDGARLIDRLAAAGPVPDWVAFTAAGQAPVPVGFSRNSGYEAIRVPLFALWSGQAASPAVRAFARAAVRAAPGGLYPVVFDPATGAVLESSAHAGYGAVAALAACASGEVSADGASVGSAMRPFAKDQPYYPATLHLMALVAQVSQFPECVPI